MEFLVPIMDVVILIAAYLFVGAIVLGSIAVGILAIGASVGSQLVCRCLAWVRERCRMGNDEEGESSVDVELALPGYDGVGMRGFGGGDEYGARYGIGSAI